MCTVARSVIEEGTNVAGKLCGGEGVVGLTYRSCQRVTRHPSSDTAGNGVIGSSEHANRLGKLDTRIFAKTERGAIVVELFYSEYSSYLEVEIVA